MSDLGKLLHLLLGNTKRVSSRVKEVIEVEIVDVCSEKRRVRLRDGAISDYLNQRLLGNISKSQATAQSTKRVRKE